MSCGILRHGLMYTLAMHGVGSDSEPGRDRAAMSCIHHIRHGFEQIAACMHEKTLLLGYSQRSSIVLIGRAAPVTWG